MSPSLRRVCLHSSLFPKKRRGELGPGRRAAAIIAKAGRNTTFTHAICSRIGPAHGRFASRSEHIGDENAAAICYETRRVVSCARTGPALCGHNNGQNNYWKKQRGEPRRRRLSRFPHARISHEEIPPSPFFLFFGVCARTPSDCSSSFGIFISTISHV